MINALIGKKIDQTQKFLQNGRRIPVTVIFVADNAVVQIKTIEKDAYAAAQLGIGIKKHSGKSATAHAKKAGIKTVPAVIREISLNGISIDEMPKQGDMITVDAVFKPGDIVEVTGTSKGKGFAGVVKRHGFRGGPKTHGQSDRERAPGSIGQTTTPGRVYRGKRMAGRMGSDTVTIKNLTVVAVDPVNKKLLVSGLVPGHRNTLLTIKRIGEDKKFVPLFSVEESKIIEIDTSEVALPAEEAPQTIVEAAAELESVSAEPVTQTTVSAEVKEDKKEVDIEARDTISKKPKMK